MSADRTTLGFVGLIFGGVTIAVILTAATVVMAHVDGRIALDAAAAVTAVAGTH